MSPWLLLGFLFTCINYSLGAAIEADHSTARSVASLNPPSEVQGLNQSAWLVCNTLPRYSIPIVRSHCQNIYDRFVHDPSTFSKQGWHGINTPFTLTKESDTCVIRLETNYRDESDEYSPAALAYVALMISRRCTLGGAASFGTKGFYVSVTGMIPATDVERGTLGLPSALTASTATA